MWMWMWACTTEPEADKPGDQTEETGTDGDTETTPNPTGDDPPEGVELLRAIAGLWNGSATETPLGAFPWMPVDLRPVNEHTIWGRVDIDPNNALRFALELEEQDGPTLVYRNGGYFLGLLRDDKTELVASDANAGTYRFCHIEQGCDYIDATYTLQGDSLDLYVLVRGMPHLHWAATRVEERDVPEAFPSLEPLPADAPLPELPTAEIAVSWATPLAADAHVWVILATTPCLDLTCIPSRASRAVVAAGESSGTVLFPEIHPGDYLMSAVLDYDRDLIGPLGIIPELTDGYSLPDRPLTVASSGTTSDNLLILLQ